MVPCYPEEAREAFGWFGSAAHNAQFFEGDLVSLHLLAAAIEGKAITLPDLKSVESARSKETLGQLLRTLGKRVPTPQADIDLWEHALAVRNGLILGFFWKNYERLQNASGCRDVAAELRDAALLFRAASQAAQRAIQACIDLLGIDRATWQRQVQEELVRLSHPGGA